MVRTFISIENSKYFEKIFRAPSYIGPCESVLIEIFKQTKYVVGYVVECN